MAGLKSRRWPNGKQRERKLLVQALESRHMLAADTFVNDNWFISNDVGASGLSAGDTVDNSADTGGAATIEATFGTTAFADVEAAIAATDEGGTVTVLEGQYAGDIDVNKSVTLEGASAGVSAGVDAGTRLGETVIDGGFQVSADNVTIDGFTITGGTGVAGDTAGVFLASGASDATIANNILTGDGAGRGILSAFNGGNDNLLIQGNNISGWTSGIFNQSNDNVDIRDNVIHDNFSGVANDFVNDALIEGNDFKNNDEAIATFESTALVATGNDLAGNTLAVANYGGAAVSAIENYWGTVNAAEITALTTGAVLTSSPLAQSPFDADEVTDLVFTGEGGATLTVNPETGEFQFSDGGELVISGAGARIQHGKLKIHTHDDEGRKIDVKGDVDGSIEVVVKQLGHGHRKQRFTLMADSQVLA